MAVINVILLAIVATTLPLVQNAPSNSNKNTKVDELQLRLVFVDSDKGNSLKSNSRVSAEKTPLLLENKNSWSQPPQTSPVFAPNDPPLVIKIIKSTSLSRMDDERQNWGLHVQNKDFDEDESYFNRPLALPKDIEKKIIENREQVTKKPSDSSKTAYEPSACDMAIITCCADVDSIMKCFNTRECNSVTRDMFTYLCSAENINTTIHNVAAYYKGS